jgi:hypothetical protein
MLGWVVLVVGLLALPMGDPGNANAHVLDVPYRDQLDGSRYALANCGPTALSMVLAYYGIDQSPWELRVRSMQAQHSWVDDEGGYSDGYGVFIYNLASVAEGAGLHTSGLWLREGTRLDRLHEWQPGEIRREVQADHPLIVQVRYRSLPRHAASTALDDHYLVIHGVRGDDFVYSDPLASGDGGPDERISEQDLMVAMNRASSPRVGFAVVRPSVKQTS